MQVDAKWKKIVMQFSKINQTASKYISLDRFYISF